jgi:hypothetical protein
MHTWSPAELNLGGVDGAEGGRRWLLTGWSLIQIESTEKGPPVQLFYFFLFYQDMY